MLGILRTHVFGALIAVMIAVTAHAAEAPPPNRPMPTPEAKSAPATPEAKSAAPAAPAAPQALAPVEQKPVPLPEAPYKDLLISKGRLLEKMDAINNEAQKVMNNAQGMVQSLMLSVKQHDEEIEKRDKAGTGNIEPKKIGVK